MPLILGVQLPPARNLHNYRPDYFDSIFKPDPTMFGSTKYRY